MAKSEKLFGSFFTLGQNASSCWIDTLKHKMMLLAIIAAICLLYLQRGFDLWTKFHALTQNLLNHLVGSRKQFNTKNSFVFGVPKFANLTLVLQCLIKLCLGILAS